VTDLNLAGAFAIGLAGAGHCLGMCGGIAAALNLGAPQSTWTTIAYHGGRLASYTLLGALLGQVAGSIDIAAWTLFLRYLAGVLLVAMGLYIADWWRGMILLEQAGARLWQPVQRLSSHLLPVRRWYQALALGSLWGLMPCGLIYSSLAWAATAQNGAQSAAMMFFFGLGTLPAMLATSLGAEHLREFLRRRGLKLILALLLIVSGLWSLYSTAIHGNHLMHVRERPAGATEHEHPHSG
jgi:sulfite exporter TauE/SafE